MRHTAATVFSHRVGAVGLALHTPPATSVNTIWPMPGRCSTTYGAPRSWVTTSSNDLSWRALCCLDLTWAKVVLPLGPLPHVMKITELWQKAGGKTLKVTVHCAGCSMWQLTADSKRTTERNAQPGGNAQHNC